MEPMAVPMLAGASAGVVARIACHPIDTIKSKLQVEVAADRARWISVVQRTLRSEGAAGLYRGIGVAAIGSCPAACLYFTTYETLKGRLQPSPLRELTAGFGAEAVACVLFVPIDVVKERLQVQGTMQGAAQYTGSLDACRAILRSEGLPGIYKGYAATLASFGPFSALYFLFYERLKSAHASHLRSSAPRTSDAMVAGASGGAEEVPVAYALLHGAAAGGAASFLTNGLDMAKLRLQVQRGAVAAGRRGEIAGQSGGGGGSFQYSGFLDAMRGIVRREGVSALFKGAGARVLFFMPSQAISIASFEYFKNFYRRLLAS